MQRYDFALLLATLILLGAVIYLGSIVFARLHDASNVDYSYLMTKTKTKRIECGKCLGKGTIEAFRAIVGGVCFSCGGAGHKKVAASHKPSKRFACVYGGQVLFWKRARTEAQALRLAVAHWRQHSNAPAFVGITEDQISVREE